MKLNDLPIAGASNTPAYNHLSQTFARLDKFAHLSSIVNWDYAAMMPPKGNESRAAALAELNLLMHSTLTAPQLAEQLKTAEQENLNEVQRANLREMTREWQTANVVPAHLVEAQTMAGARCEHAWRSQRPANDWLGFLANFKEVLKLSREQAHYLQEAFSATDATVQSPYDALMQRFEPGMNSAAIDAIFSNVKTWLPNLIKKTQEKQQSLADQGSPILQPQGPFSIEAQRALGLEVMQLLGFDFEGGRLDMSTHPFCGGVPQDVRITTRYRTDDFTGSLMGIVHETGHARYEQNLPRDWLGQPIAHARSMGIHESQSLSFEMQIGCNPAFLKLITPLIKKHLGDQAAFTEQNLGRLYTKVHPSYIRVDADELCYPAHIILRFEIERALINGEIEAEDIPSIWDKKMMEYLGVDTRGNYKDGCLQDIHWTDGMFGYFPSYTLGAMYAAQYFATIRKAQPKLDQQIAQGQFETCFDWLKQNIWSTASRYDTNELVTRATGETLNPQHYRAHLENRYLG